MPTLFSLLQKLYYNGLSNIKYLSAEKKETNKISYYNPLAARARK
jgi:hypothetical protein